MPDADYAGRLEEQVRLLAAALDIEAVQLGKVVSADVVALARAGRQVDAVRLLRDQTGVGLVEAKRIVDAAADVR